MTAEGRSDDPDLEELRPRLDEIFAKIEEWAAYAGEAGGWPEVESHSSLAADDAIYPRQPPSHIGWHNISSAVDHLHLLKVVIHDARVFHLLAPYSLLRVALDAATQALWVLAVPTRKARQVHALRLVYDDAMNIRKVAALAGGTDEGAEKDLARIPTLAATLGVPEGSLTARPDMPQMIRETTPLLVDDPEMIIASEISWRWASGHVHSMRWPSLTALRGSAVSTGEPVMSFRMTGNWAQFFAVLLDAYYRTGVAIERYEARRRAP